MAPYNRKRGVYEGKHRRRPSRRTLRSRRHRKPPWLSSPSSTDRSESARSEDREEAAFAKTIRQLPEKLIVELPCGTIKKIADLLQSEEDDTKPIHIIVYSSDMHPHFNTTDTPQPIAIGRPSLRRSNSKNYSHSRTRSMRYHSYRSRRSNRSRKRPFPH